MDAIVAWHTMNVVRALRNVRPEMETVRIPWAIGPRRPTSHVGRSLRWAWCNPVTVGAPAWMSNRMVTLRAFWLRLHAALARTLR